MKKVQQILFVAALYTFTLVVSDPTLAQTIDPRIRAAALDGLRKIMSSVENMEDGPHKIVLSADMLSHNKLVAQMTRYMSGVDSEEEALKRGQDLAELLTPASKHQKKIRSITKAAKTAAKKLRLSRAVKNSFLRPIRDPDRAAKIETLTEGESKPTGSAYDDENDWNAPVSRSTPSPSRSTSEVKTDSTRRSSGKRRTRSSLRSKGRQDFSAVAEGLIGDTMDALDSMSVFTDSLSEQGDTPESSTGLGPVQILLCATRLKGAIEMEEAARKQTALSPRYAERCTQSRRDADHQLVSYVTQYVKDIQTSEEALKKGQDLGEVLAKHKEETTLVIDATRKAADRADLDDAMLDAVLKPLSAR